MRKIYIVVIALTLISLPVVAACVPGWGPETSGGGGMMGPSGPDQSTITGTPNPYSYGGGMMGGGGMGPGMMGGSWGNYNTDPNAKTITIDQAADAVHLYLNPYGGKLVLTEVMDFAWNYYGEVEEKDTGVYAMEILIDKHTGWVSPEMGPNMMWNTKYSPMGGMMGNYGGRSPTANMPVTPDQAKTSAQKYLDTNLPGPTIAEADTFYGYYTLHTLKNGQVEGMLSVNGYTGAVWYHTWHGSFLGMKDYEAAHD